MNKLSRLLLTVLLTFSLINCGGGGSSNNNPAPSPTPEPAPEPTPEPEPELSSQEIEFELSGPISLEVGESIQNPASAPGSGSITYTSEDDRVATVGNDGEIAAVGAGSTQIIATIKEDSEYSEATASYRVDVSRKENNLSFSGAEIQTVRIGETFSNPASSISSGEITYSSSNTDIATVDASGRATAHGLGQTVISAEQSVDETYESASTQYEVRTSTWMNAWAGESNTQLQFQSDVYGLNLYSFTDHTCNVDNISSCTNGTVLSVDDSITDSNATLNTPAYYKVHGTEQIPAWPHHFSRREEHQVVEFDNQLWLYGGTTGGRTTFAPSVSSDGKIWQQLDSNLTATRSGHQIVKHNGKLFLIAGNSSGAMNDVWSTTNGTDWTLVTGNAEFSPRTRHQVVSFEGRLWLIGGENFTPSRFETYSDVWSSADGVSWTLESNAAPFGERSEHSVSVFNGRLWLSGGSSDEENPQVWSSADGQEWQKEATLTQFRYLSDHQMLAHQDKLWIIGRGSYNRSSDIWSSDDGVNWQQTSTSDSPIGESLIYSHQAVSFQNRLWIIGGIYGVPVSENGTGAKRRSWVWSSVSGERWVKESPEPPLPEIYYYDFLPVVASDSQLMVFDTIYKNTDNSLVVAQSTDGLQWQRYKTEGGLVRRSGHQMVYFNDKYWLIGGWKIRSDGSTTNDVWSSTDGISWSLEASDAGFPASASRHQVIIHNDQLWLFAQSEINDIPTNEIWSSSDGVNWNRVTSLPQYAPLERYDVTSFNGKLWVSGGYGSSDHMFKRNVWHSEDGANWEQVIPLPPFQPRAFHELESFNGKLWLIGGYDRHIDALNDIWTSSDGVTWNLVTDHAPFSPRYMHQVLKFNGALWMFGGNGQNHEDLRDPWRFTEVDGWRKGYTRELIAD